MLRLRAPPHRAYTTDPTKAHTTEPFNNIVRSMEKIVVDSNQGSSSGVESYSDSRD